MLSFIVFFSEPTVNFVSYLTLNDYTIVFSPLLYQEYNNIITRIVINKGGDENDVANYIMLLDKFLFHNSFCVLLKPLNIFHFKGEVEGDKYYNLRIVDSKDLFLLDLAKFSKSSYIGTNDKKLIKAVGSSINTPTYFHETLIAHQSYLMNLFKI